MTTSARLGITQLASTQNDRSVTVNEAIAILEAFGGYIQAKSVGDNSPPGSPAEGDIYVVGTAGTGAFSGHNKAVALYYNAAWVFRSAIEGMLAYSQAADTWSKFDGTSWGSAGFGSNPTESIIIAVGDETTAITTGTAKVTFGMPYAFTVTAVRARLTTAQASGSIFTVDVNEGGTSILSTKLTIDNTEKTSTTAATAPVISDTSLADDAEITIDVDQIGDGTAKGLKVVLIGSRT